MTANDIKEELEEVEKHIFYAQMADFMDWSLYYKLSAKKAELQKKLQEVK